MSGRRYQVFMAPSAYRRYKKFDAGLQQKIKEEARYRIAYRILEDKKEIEVVLVKSRERFYQTLRRIIKSS